MLLTLSDLVPKHVHLFLLVAIWSFRDVRWCMMYVLEVFLFFLIFWVSWRIASWVRRFPFSWNLKEIYEQSQKVLCLKRSVFFNPFDRGFICFKSFIGPSQYPLKARIVWFCLIPTGCIYIYKYCFFTIEAISLSSVLCFSGENVSHHSGSPPKSVWSSWGMWMLRICRVSCGTFTMKWWSEPHGSLGSRSSTGIFGAGKTGCQLGWVVLELIRRDESLKSYPSIMRIVFDIAANLVCDELGLHGIGLWGFLRGSVGGEQPIQKKFVGCGDGNHLVKFA